MRLKIGDIVKWREDRDKGFVSVQQLGSFYQNRDVFIISCVDLSDNTCQVVGDNNWCSLFWFEKVEPKHEIGKKYFVSNNVHFLEDPSFCLNPDFHRILAAYVPNAKTPFVCVHKDDETEFKNGGTYEIRSWRYIKEIPPITHRAYTSAKKAFKEHINETIKINNTQYIVVGWRRSKALIVRDLRGECRSFELDYLFQYSTLLNDQQFGEKID